MSPPGPASSVRWLPLFFAVGLLYACASPGAVDGLVRARELAHSRGLQAESLYAGGFRLQAWLRPANQPGEVLHIYLEGDGAAWPSPYHPPVDPTPRHPVALSLATNEPQSAVAYLGRPCQYLDPAALADCPSEYWVERRYAPEVIDAYDRLLDQLQQRYAARGLHLFGYSGGGVLATLLAAHRNDVVALTTVAAPLSLDVWRRTHHASELHGSIDPGSAAIPGTIRHWQQALHYVGGQDSVVPPAVVEHFVQQHGGRIERVDGYTHTCCWARDWPRWRAQQVDISHAH